MNDDSPTLQVPDTLDFLLGTWRLERSIEDRRTPSRGTFVGQASLIGTSAVTGPVTPQRARYDEAGQLQIGGYRGPARRTLEFVRLDDASVLVCFGDGRPYIDLDLRTGACDRIHNCGADRYQIQFIVRAHNVLEERWVVNGPQKDYEAVTTLTRQSARV